MQQTLAWIVGYGSIGVYYVGAMLAALLLVGGAFVMPRLIVFGLLVVLVVFPNSASTAVAGEYGFNVFGKGQRFFFFSIIELIVLALGMLTAVHHWLRTRWNAPLPLPVQREPSYRNPYVVFYAMFAMLCLGWAASDLVQGKDTWLLQFGRPGVMSIVMQGLLLAALVRVCDRPERLERGVRLLAAIASLVMLFGLVRYVALGGDPQGFYETEGAAQLKITFWDINYLVFITGLGCWLLWTAADMPEPRRWLARNGLVLLALLAFVAVALSARRTAQVGVLASLIGLLVLLPRGRKLSVVLLLALTSAAVGYKLAQRIDDPRPLLERMVKGDLRQQYLFDPRYDRYYELRLAWKTVQKQPLLGVGPAGRFEAPGPQGLEYHRGNYGFVHSGFGHVLLKTGFVGLAALVGLLAVYLWLLVAEWRRADHAGRGVLVFSGAGMVAMTPVLALGTPFIELRTALTMGVLLALPLILRRLRTAPAPAPAPLPAYARAGGWRVEAAVRR